MSLFDGSGISGLVQVPARETVVGTMYDALEVGVEEVGEAGKDGTAVVSAFPQRQTWPVGSC